MNENINLCEILKGHEGKTFYSPVLGDLTFECINYPLVRFRTKRTRAIYDILAKGKLYNDSDELIVFPSKNQRDWTEWDKENNKKTTPKTWSELCLAAQVEEIEVSTDVIFNDNDVMIDRSCAVGSNLELAKAALALLKIHQLIEVGYGGNVTYNCFENQVTYGITHCGDSNSFEVYQIADIYEYSSHIHFHTKKQAEEFLSKPENVELLKDYFMI